MAIDKIVLLTGATGFVGRALAKSLDTKELRLLSRRDPQLAGTIFCEATIDGYTDYTPHLNRVDVIVHAAARAHVMSDNAIDPLDEYRAVNVAGTLNLARQAAKAGVKRFIFISSVKVNGEITELGQAFSAFDKPAPKDYYGISKAEAEDGLRQLSVETGMEVTIIRAPLVYGPGVKANFGSLLKLAEKNLPLPLGSIHNARSMVGIRNLVDLIVTCIEHPIAGNQVFMASDGKDVSTSDLLKKMTLAYGKKPRLFPFPTLLMSTAARLSGKQAIADRLFGSLRVDIEHTKNKLGWEPKFSLEEELEYCVASLSRENTRAMKGPNK